MQSADELRRENEALRQRIARTRADLETLVETSPVGVAVFDARTGRPVSFNREAARIVEGLGQPGQPPERLLETMTCRFADGRTLAQLPLTQPAGAVALRAEEIVLSVPAGREVRTQGNATPIRGDGGEVESVVVTLQDPEPLEKLERLRTELLGMVGHELRAPLTAIKGSTATVLGAAATVDQAQMLQFFRLIDEQADRMGSLIGDLLDTGRIEAGTLSLSTEPTAVAGLVDQARNTFLSGGGRRPVRVDLPPELPRVTADPRRVVQVLNNLLSSAARHSPAASPIRVTAASDGAHVAISVSDEGRGATAGAPPRLFEKHGAGDAGREPGLGASGLSLTICKGLVEAHGGRIRAESGGKGEGARVTFTLPVADDPRSRAAGAAGGRPAEPREEGRRTRILVVDDDPQTLRYVCDALSSAGYAPLATGDPRELPELVRTKKPRLVLLDPMPPATDGIELMRRVRELADVPVIFISGYGSDETIAQALEVGATDYIVKPFSPAELTARVQTALRRRAQRVPYRLGDLVIDYERRRVTVAGRRVDLTAIEFELLRVLSTGGGRVSTVDALLRQVWGGRRAGDPKLLRAFVKGLRRKLGDDAASPAYIFTERGVGYRMAVPGEAVEDPSK